MNIATNRRAFGEAIQFNNVLLRVIRAVDNEPIRLTYIRSTLTDGNGELIPRNDLQGMDAITGRLVRIFYFLDHPRIPSNLDNGDYYFITYRNVWVVTDRVLTANGIIGYRAFTVDFSQMQGGRFLQRIANQFVSDQRGDAGIDVFGDDRMYFEELCPEIPEIEACTNRINELPFISQLLRVILLLSNRQVLLSNDIIKLGDTSYTM